jgi:hypothetical protein
VDLTPRKRWTDFSSRERSAILGLAAVELVTTTVAVVDLVRRPAERVRGPKALWCAASAVQPFGPVAYLLFGRRRPVAAPDSERPAA